PPDLDDVQDKITRLATGIPAEKYTWRPSPGVRSVSEVFMHIAGGHYFLTTFVGEQPPADMPKDIEKVNEKTRVLTELKKSFDHLRRVIANESDADLDKSVSMFGTPSTHRHVFNTIMNHLHEHLGQSIAYARMNGIVPPWSH
ncbi:MAG: DinB family protein, partial [Thermoanaerobaculia bacterium]